MNDKNTNWLIAVKINLTHAVIKDDVVYAQLYNKDYIEFIYSLIGTIYTFKIPTENWHQHYLGADP